MKKTGFLGLLIDQSFMTFMAFMNFMSALV